MSEHHKIINVRSLHAVRTLLTEGSSYQTDVMNQVLRDMRVLSGYAGRWVEEMFDFRRPVVLGQRTIYPDTARLLRASVRCFWESNIRFQKPVRTGAFREELFNHEDLVEDVERIDYYVIVDARKFPRLDFYPMSSDKIQSYVYSRKLNLSGMSPHHFDKFIRENYTTRFPDLDDEGEILRPGQDPRTMGRYFFVPDGAVVMQIKR